jgi:rubrerythrin
MFEEVVRERTCQDEGTRFNAWVCSECKATLLLLFDDCGEPTYSVDGVADVPRYCPNCGAKVVGR